MKLELNERTARAVELLARRSQLQKEIVAFVGEAELDWSEGQTKLREIASEGVMEAAKAQVKRQKPL